MHWREQGDRGEMAAAAWYAAQGGYVFWPMGHSRDVDLVADLEGRLIRVQVKTCGAFRKRWEVTTCTRGGNQSWNGLTKRLDASRFDELFVLVADGRQWRFPSDEVDGRTGLMLGGPKWAHREVEPNPAFAWTPRPPRRVLH
jgi:hypothetical protein